MTVRLVEAAPVAGALRFELLSEGRYNGGGRAADCRARVPSIPPVRRAQRAAAVKRRR